MTDAMRRQTREINRSVMAPQLRMIGESFKPVFHPWKCRDARHIAEWIEATEGAA